MQNLKSSIIKHLIDNGHTAWNSNSNKVVSNINVRITGIDIPIEIYWVIDNGSNNMDNVSFIHINSFEDFLQKYNEIIFKYS
jgi:hypothetical protein